MWTKAPFERRTDVAQLVGISCGPPRSRQGQHHLPLRFEKFCNVFRVSAGDHIELVMLLQFSECVCPRRVKQSVLLLTVVKPSYDQRLFDQTGDGVEDLCVDGTRLACDIPRALNGEMADVRTDASKDDPLSVRQQIVAPIQCRLEGPVSGNGRTMAEFQQFQPQHQAGNRVLDAEYG